MLFTSLTTAIVATTTLFTSFTIAVDTGVYLCSESYWGGHCTWTDLFKNYRECIAIPNKGGVGSFGPDKYIWVNIYSDSDCYDLLYSPLTYPGLTDTAPWIPADTTPLYIIAHNCSVDAVAQTCY